jgi:hypothetical protein
MPALSGQVIVTLTGADGQPVIVATWFYDPATGILRNGTFTTSTGDKTGALIVDNRSGSQQTVTITNDTGTRNVNVSANGFVATATQLANLNPPLTTSAQLNGFTFTLS